MNEWWTGLAARERLFVGGLGVFIVLSLIYLLLIEPLFDGANKYTEQVNQAEADLAWMQRNASRLPKGQGGRQARPPTSLLSIVDQTTKSLDLKTEGNQRIGADGIRVQVKDASFDKIVSWLGQMHANYAVDIEAANITQRDPVGTADANLTLRRTGGVQ